MLPHGKDSASVQKVRQMSASLSDRDDGFKPLRAKIHGAPGRRGRRAGAGLRGRARREVAAPPYLALADEIDQVYQAAPLDQDLEEMAAKLHGGALAAGTAERRRPRTCGPMRSAANRFAATATLLADLRDALPRIRSAAARLEILDLEPAGGSREFPRRRRTAQRPGSRHPRAAPRVPARRPGRPPTAPA